MYKRIVRRDGSVIILAPKKDTKAVTFEVLYKVGSRQENDKNNGVSHFVEHLMFKGTERRPSTADIAKELDSVGANYNAFTGKEYTGYYVTVNNSHMIMAIDMLSDILHNSKFDKEEIDRERGVIVEEINMYEDNPMMYIEEVFENILFNGTNLGRSIAGPRVNIQTISRNALYNYHKKHYYHGNAIIGLAGNFNEKQALKLIDKLFPISKKQARIKNKALPIIKQIIPAVEIIDRDLEQVQLMLGFRTSSVTDKDFILNQVMANILGGTMSSRLFLNIRERQGLCYFIKAEVGGYEGASSFAVHAGLNKEKIYEALSAIKEELNNLAKNGISKEELAQAKENIKGRMVLKMESSSVHLNFLISQEAIGKPIKDLDARLKELDKISLKQINNLTVKIIDWSQSNLAIIGPFKNKNKFVNILKK
ncbi:MAG: insulinase family protein [Candidatus Komeilibacteria bacterium]|jgi:predicted Zn-dependent peptidase|nr:insulinase family protein [Candidatus Komeilibacteria bacterium]MBT4447289.1 insulinase family protein [Candidatus Komeilibacteria bacterium]